MSAEFLVTTLIVVATPGTGVLYTLAAGLAHGGRASVIAAFAAYGLFASAVRTHVVSRPRVMAWMRRSFAGAFVALGARLATTSR